MLGFFQRLKKRRGFTLIELIVVIAILAILAAILVPTMMSVIGTARQQVKESNAAAVFSAAQAAYVTLVSVNGAEIATGPHASGSGDALIAEIERNLGAGTSAKEAYTVHVTANGISHVVYGNGTDTVTYPTSAGTSTTTSTGTGG